jgi:hypothetical protein
MRLSDCKTLEEMSVMLQKFTLHGIDNCDGHLWISRVDPNPLYDFAHREVCEMDDEYVMFTIKADMLFDNETEAVKEAIKVMKAERPNQVIISFQYKTDYWNLTELDIDELEKKIAAGEDVKLSDIAEARLEQARSTDK